MHRHLHACGQAPVHLCHCADHLQLESEAGKCHATRRAPIQSEKLALSAKLTTVHIPLRPSEAVLAPLPGKRDTLPNNRTIHSLLLTYKLSVAEAGKHTVTLPPLNR